MTLQHTQRVWNRREVLATGWAVAGALGLKACLAKAARAIAEVRKA